jgi:hypothetical protein
VRLFDRRRCRWAGTDPHDRVETAGKVVRISEGALEHFTYRSFDDHVRKMDRFTTVAAEELVRRGRRASLLSLWLRPPWRFLRMYVLRLGFLDGSAGFALARMDARYVFLKYAKARDLLRAAQASSR